MTQGKAAELIGVSRATFTQWETARHLPAKERVHDLDRLLDARGELVAAAQRIRAGHGPRPVEGVIRTPAAGTGSLLRLLDDTRTAFLDQLCIDANGRPTGWRHHLVESSTGPSVLSTAYGLKVLAMLGGPDARTPAVVDWVLANAVRDGDRIVGWKARAQRAPRLETTGAALDGLLRAGVPISVDDVLRMLGDLVDDSARARPFILMTALEPLLRVAPDSGLAAELVRTLLACRRDFDDVSLWPEKRVSRDQPKLDPSVAHTARAVVALRRAPGELLGDGLAQAEQWLAETPDLGGTSEFIRRDFDDNTREDLPIHHFTSTWVVRALAGAAAPDPFRISRALTHVWDRYVPELHFWAWGNGDVPVWLLADSVAALQDAALAGFPIPAGVALEPG